jgi:hypothetical protein
MKAWSDAFLRRKQHATHRHPLFDAAIVASGVLLVLALATIGIRLAELRDTLTMRLERKAELLNTLVAFEAQIGYGGLIHNYKNAILRPAEVYYLYSAETDVANAFRLLDQIAGILHDIGDPLSVEPTRRTLEIYATNLQILRENLGKVVDPRQLDALVRVQTTDALKNLATLVAEARQKIQDRVNEESAAIERLADLFALSAALLMTLGLLFLRRGHLETLSIRALAGRQTAFLFDQISECVIGLSHRRDIVFLNAPARRMLGTTSMVRPFPWPEGIRIRANEAAGDAADADDLLDSAIAGESVWKLPAVVTWPDGRSFAVKFSCLKVEASDPVVAIVILLPQSGSAAPLAAAAPPPARRDVPPHDR